MRKLDADVQILISGAKFSNEYVKVERANVQKSTGFEASFCEIVITGKLEKLIEDENLFYTSASTKFKLCKDIEIKIKSKRQDSFKSVFIGFIMEKKLVRREGTTELHIIGGDIKYIMMNNSDFRVFSDCSTYSSVAESVIKLYSSLSKGSEVTKSSSIEHDVVQCNISDYDFLVDISEKIGYKFFVEDGKIYFVPTAPAGAFAPIISSMFGSGKVEASSDEYKVEEVSVRRSCYSKVDKVTLFSQSASDTGKSFKGSASLSDVTTIGKGKNEYGSLDKWSVSQSGHQLMDSTIASSSEAEDLAKAFIQEKSMDSVEIHCIINGFASLPLNSTVTFKGFDSPIDGEYKVSELIYRMDDGSLEMEVLAKSNTCDL